MKRFSLVVLLGLAIALVVPGSAASIVYSNGPINGDFNAFSFSEEFRLANSFVSTGPVTITGFDAGIWTLQDPYGRSDYPTTVTWEILTGGPDWMGGTVIASGDRTWSNTWFALNRGFNCDVWSSTISGLNVSIGAGNYWLELLNGHSVMFDAAYWDINFGPSQVYGFPVGPGWSESFTIYGTPVPEPGTFLMFGSGLLGVAHVIRRKLML